jgi:hypothetical protein
MSRAPCCAAAPPARRQHRLPAHARRPPHARLCAQVTYLGAGGAGVRRTVDVSVVLGAVALPLAYKW